MDRVLIVTGASRGLGAATAVEAARRGASVLLAARSEVDLHHQVVTIQAGGGRAHPVVADLARPEDCRRVVEEALDRFGRIDGLVNNAGVLEPIGRIRDADPGSWHRNWEVNLLAPLILTREALPALRRARGRVVNVSSGAAVHPIAGWAAYCQAKAALNMLTAVLAVEEPEITALAIRPGVVDTGMQGVIRETGDQGMDPEEHRRFLEFHSTGELLRPSDPGRVLAALALEAPPAWTGRFLSWDAPEIRELMEEGP